MSRLRATHHDEPLSSSDEDEDVFSALAKRAAGKGKKGNTKVPAPPPPKLKVVQNEPPPASTSTITANPSPFSSPPLPHDHGPSGVSATNDAGPQHPTILPKTSSTKRHHGGSRRQDLDSLLVELKEVESSQTLIQQQHQHRQSSQLSAAGGGGSHVRSGEEDTTTNVFVGNLAPTTTLKQLAHFFAQFGELYSTKIMWPRDGVAMTKLNGFVCYVHRADAENAMDAVQEMDPFGTGHVLTLSWGKCIFAAAVPDKNLNDNNNNNGAGTPSAQKVHQKRRGGGEYYDSDKEDEVAWHRQETTQRQRGKLSFDEQVQFERLFRTHLSASRDAICRAMAFCFEKSTAALDICNLWRPILCQGDKTDSVDTLVARLYLLSDVLFNAQQPGVRHAFLYRNFVQDVGPTALRRMGDHARANFGRIKQDRLTLAVKAVLGAWATWGVYDAAFLYEARCAYEGKEAVEVPNNHGIDGTGIDGTKPDDDASHNRNGETSKIKSSSTSLGDEELRGASGDQMQMQFVETDDIDGEPLEEGDLEGMSWSVQDNGSVAANDDIDGEAMDGDVVVLEE